MDYCCLLRLWYFVWLDYCMLLAVADWILDVVSKTGLHKIYLHVNLLLTLQTQDIKMEFKNTEKDLWNIFCFWSLRKQLHEVNKLLKILQGLCSCKGLCSCTIKKINIKVQRKKRFENSFFSLHKTMDKPKIIFLNLLQHLMLPMLFAIASYHFSS